MMPPLNELIIAMLLLCSGSLVLTAAVGQHRLPDFFTRMHAPAMASTLGVWIVALASVIHFSTRAGELRIHVWLIIIMLSISAPVTTIVLARAALFRRRRSGDPLPSPMGARDAAPASEDNAGV